MKKIFIALALIASVQFAGAQTQTKSYGDAKEALESAKADSQNAKKAAKYATWLKLGQAYIDAFNAPVGNTWLGSSRTEFQLVMSKVKAKAADQEVEMNGKKYVKSSYPNCDYYFENGVVAIYDVTKPIEKDLVQNALEAYKKAYELDTKKAKTNDIKTAIETCGKKFTDLAYNSYNLGKLDQASKMFEAAADAQATEPLAKIDTNAIYNAGFTADLAGDQDRAIKFLEKALELGYEGLDGDIYARMSAIFEKKGDQKTSVEYLEKGFSKYPQNQGILVGLINYYISSNSDTNRLFELLAEAQKNEPDNASLYYVEGNIQYQLGNKEKAVEAYRKSSAVNPEYEFGWIGEGIMLCQEADKIAAVANEELDDAKYMALVKEYEANLKACIEPFLKGYDLCKSEDTKRTIAQYIKQASFRFREESEEYMQIYEKFAKLAE